MHANDRSTNVASSCSADKIGPRRYYSTVCLAPLVVFQKNTHALTISQRILHDARLPMFALTKACLTQRGCEVL
jgi:hypothetical protein